MRQRRSRRERAAKRGGGLAPVPWEEEKISDAGGGAATTPAHVQRRAEEARFDRDWAAALLDHVLGRLEAECRAARGGGAGYVEALFPFLAGGSGENAQEAHARAAAGLSLGLAAFRSVLHGWRVRQRALSREAVAGTLTDPREIDAEVRHLLAALAAAEAG